MLERVRAFPAQAFVERALLDAEQRRACGVFLACIEAVAAASGPAHRHFHRAGDDLAGLVGTRAFVEGHDHVGAEQALDSIERSGVSIWREPSRWLAKVTPSSVILRRSERLSPGSRRCRSGSGAASS